MNVNATDLAFEIGNRHIETRQSPGLLKSDTSSGGNLGAVVWEASPRLAKWLVTKSSLLWNIGVLRPDASIVELGCGIAGLVGLALSPLVSSYILTDQQYVMKHLQANLELNRSSNILSSKRKAASDSNKTGLRTLSLDWELADGKSITHALGPGGELDLLIACDCIYNEFLIEPFVTVCEEICSASSSGEVLPLVLVCQQLRSSDIFEQWLIRMLKTFKIWRVPDEHLPKALHNASGFAIHVCQHKTCG